MIFDGEFDSGIHESSRVSLTRQKLHVHTCFDLFYTWYKPTSRCTLDTVLRHQDTLRGSLSVSRGPPKDSMTCHFLVPNWGFWNFRPVGPRKNFRVSEVWDHESWWFLTNFSKMAGQNSTACASCVKPSNFRLFCMDYGPPLGFRLLALRRGASHHGLRTAPRISPFGP